MKGLLIILIITFAEKIDVIFRSSIISVYTYSNLEI